MGPSDLGFAHRLGKENGREVVASHDNPIPSISMNALLFNIEQCCQAHGGILGVVLHRPLDLKILVGDFQLEILSDFMILLSLLGQQKKEIGSHGLTQVGAVRLDLGCRLPCGPCAG